MPAEPQPEEQAIPQINNLEDYRDLFASSGAMEEFAGMLEQSAHGDAIPLWLYRQRHIITGLSPEATDRFFSDRILQRLVKNPEMLDTVVKRVREMTSDDLVD